MTMMTKTTISMPWEKRHWWHWTARNAKFVSLSSYLLVRAFVFSSVVLIVLQTVAVPADALGSLYHVHLLDPIHRRPHPDPVDHIHRRADHLIYPPLVHIRWMPMIKTIVSKAKTNQSLETSMNGSHRISPTIMICWSSTVLCKMMIFSWTKNDRLPSSWLNQRLRKSHRIVTNDRVTNRSWKKFPDAKKSRKRRAHHTIVRRRPLLNRTRKSLIYGNWSRKVEQRRHTLRTLHELTRNELFRFDRTAINSLYIRTFRVGRRRRAKLVNTNGSGRLQHSSQRIQQAFLLFVLSFFNEIHGYSSFDTDKNQKDQGDLHRYFIRDERTTVFDVSSRLLQKAGEREKER